jgi:hypothetical protein
MSNVVGSRIVQGSAWNRWDAHIHAPGTILNVVAPAFVVKTII